MERQAARGAAAEGSWGSWFVAGWGSETTDSDPRASGAGAVGVAGSARRGSARRSSNTLARRSPAAAPASQILSHVPSGAHIAARGFPS